MKVCLISGHAEGPNKLTAYDNATIMAGIGNVNIIQVSSMIKKDTELVSKLPEFESGSMVKAVRARLCSYKHGERISVAVGVAIGKKGHYGCVGEIVRKGASQEEMKKDIHDSLEYMMKQRGQKIENIYSIVETHTVDTCGSVVAGLVYIEE